MENHPSKNRKMIFWQSVYASKCIFFYIIVIYLQLDVCAETTSPKYKFIVNLEETQVDKILP
jgi:hypothetical protein